MTPHNTANWLALFALCSCQPKEDTKTTSDASAAGSNGQSQFVEQQERVIPDWDVAVVGTGENVKLVEWPSKEPIGPSKMKVAIDWGFVIAETRHGPRLFEWPSLKPIPDERKNLEHIDPEDLPPLPESRWVK